MKKNAFTADDVSKICGVTIQKRNKIPFPCDLAEEWSYRVLIVNEDRTIVTRLTGLIKERYDHFLISSAIDGLEAGRKILSFKPDLVILGLKLPGYDGFEICRKLKSEPETKNKIVLVVAGYNPEKIKDKIISCGADGYLSKPFDIEQISAYLNEFGINLEV